MQIKVDNLIEDFRTERNINLSLLRLDLIHPAVSGNKWFKLKLNIAEALKKNITTLLSFGGPYSNHLHAMAFACKQHNLKSVGIIRGERPLIINETLQDCENFGMQLHYISREDYNLKNNTDFVESLHSLFGNFYLVPEGGNNVLGIKGCSEISGFISNDYNVICLPVGTSASMSGVVLGSEANQKVIGFSALKGAEYLNNELHNSIQKIGVAKCLYQINHDYHFGGFAKHKPELIEFMNSFRKKNNIELDFIYTAKMMYGIYDLIKKGEIKKDSCIMAIHTGGLQGNRSLSNILE